MARTPRPAGGRRLRGAPQGSLFATCNDARPEELIEHGDQVVAPWRWGGRGQGSGVEFDERRETWIYTVAAGKIVRIRGDRRRGAAVVSSEPVPVSIVIPTRDRPAELERCLDAVSRLDYPRSSFEVIVIDDGGQRPAAAVAEPFGDQLDVAVHRQERTGPGLARNSGARRAGGTVVAFTDDDCEPVRDWLMELNRSLDGDDCAVAGCTINAFPYNPYATTSHLIIDALQAYYNAGAQEPRFFATNNLAIPAKTFARIGGFSTDPAFRFAGEDREFWDRWGQAGLRLRYAPGAVVRHGRNLTLGDFLRQHFGYGYAVYPLYRNRHRSGRFPDRPDPRFHASLFRRTARSPGLLALTFVSQLCVLAGSACGAVKAPRSRTTRGTR